MTFLYSGLHGRIEMSNEICDDRPSLRIEQPPDWWIEKRRREIEAEQKDKPKRGVMIIDIGTGQEKSDKDENGVIILQM